MSDANLDKTPRLEKPIPPDPQDCCGGGCVPCVYDYYYDALEKWQAVMDSKQHGDSSSGSHKSQS